MAIYDQEGNLVSAPATQKARVRAAQIGNNTEGAINQAKAAASGIKAQLPPPPSITPPPVAPAPAAAAGPALPAPTAAPAAAPAAAPTAPIYVDKAGTADYAPKDIRSSVEQVKANIAADKAARMAGQAPVEPVPQMATPKPGVIASAGQKVQAAVNGAANAAQNIRAGVQAADAAAGQVIGDRAGRFAATAAPEGAGIVGKTVNGAKNLAKGAVKAGVAGAGIGAAIEGYNTPTEQYAERFGFDKSNVGQSFVKDVGIRSLGLASDLGRNLVRGVTFGAVDPGRVYADRPDVKAQQDAGVQAATGNDPYAESLKAPQVPSSNPAAGSGTGSITIGGKTATIKDGVIGGDDIGAKGRGTVSVLDTSAGYAADKQALSQAFGKHLASGDVEGMMRTASTPEEFAQVAALRERNQAREMDRLRQYELDQQRQNDIRSFQSTVDKASTAARFGSTKQIKAFNALSQAQGQMLQRADAGIRSGTAEKLPSAEDAARSGLIKAQTEKENMDIANAKSIAAMRDKLGKSTDETEKKSIRSDLLTMQGKSPAEGKIAVIDYDTGQVDAMGQPIYKKMAINTDTGQQFTGNAPAPSNKLPAGMVKLVGTSNGKPVYEDANGKRHIQE